MRSSVTLLLALISSWIPFYVTSFNVFVGAQQLNNRPPASCQASEEESSDPSQDSGPTGTPVDKAAFVEALEALQNAMAQAAGVQVNTAETEEKMYAIGKLKATLAIDTQPELDLTEAAGLVLISHVSGKAKEAGIQVGDTIIGVYAADQFIGSTKESTLEETVAVLQPAMGVAMENGKSEIELELNRLIRLQYA